MIYDDVNRKWLPSGSSSGLSRVHIYHHTVNKTFRVVGRKLQDHEVWKQMGIRLPSFSVQTKALSSCIFLFLLTYGYPHNVNAFPIPYPGNNNKQTTNKTKLGGHKLCDRSWIEVQSGDTNVPSVEGSETGLWIELQY